MSRGSEFSVGQEVWNLEGTMKGVVEEIHLQPSGKYTYTVKVFTPDRDITPTAPDFKLKDWNWLRIELQENAIFHTKGDR